MKILNFTTLYFLPIISIVFGILTMFKIPKKINKFFGYRTNLSMKNIDTWNFAHRVSGISGFLYGVVALIIAVIYNNNYANYDEVGLFMDSILIMTIEITIFIIATVVPTEVLLHVKFDKDGNKK